jgi:predicted FMN-binding regulatory protein PaiB
MLMARIVAASPHATISPDYLFSERNHERNVRIWCYLVRRRQRYFRVGLDRHGTEKGPDEISMRASYSDGDESCHWSRYTRKSHVPRLTTVDELERGELKGTTRLDTTPMATWNAFLTLSLARLAIAFLQL